MEIPKHPQQQYSSSITAPRGNKREEMEIRKHTQQQYNYSTTKEKRWKFPNTPAAI